MSTAELFICKYADLKLKKSIMKFYDDIKDEVISYIDNEGNVVSYSSVCPHLAGEVVILEKNEGFYCKWHGLHFNEQGHAMNCKARLTLRKYESIVRNESVYLIYEP